jgi:hypothetical protein
MAQSEEASSPIYASNYFMCQWVPPTHSPHPSELLHLNQASIKDLICNLTGITEVDTWVSN